MFTLIRLIELELMGKFDSYALAVLGPSLLLQYLRFRVHDTGFHWGLFTDPISSSLPTC